jgi:hypothetical protein
VHRQANFAALSVLAQATGREAPAMFVVTDRPEYYRWLREHLTVIEVGPETLDEWRAPHGYFWRIKLKVMQRVNDLSHGNLVYLDSDVACSASLGDFFDALDAGAAFMHVPEYSIGSRNGKGRALWRQTANRGFGPFTVQARNRMWNAGLVALPAAVSRQWLADALACLDAMGEAKIASPFLEQFSLSMSLDRHGDLRPADRWFIHYWGNKPPWNALIARFLADVHLRQVPVADACASLRLLPLDIPPIVRRNRLERLINSVTKRISPRSESVLAQVSRELTR